MGISRTRKQKEHAAQMRVKELQYSLKLQGYALESGSLKESLKASPNGQPSSFSLKSPSFSKSTNIVTPRPRETLETLESLFGYSTRLIYKDLLKTVAVTMVVLVLLTLIYFRFR